VKKKINGTVICPAKVKARLLLYHINPSYGTFDIKCVSDNSSVVVYNSGNRLQISTDGQHAKP